MSGSWPREAEQAVTMNLDFDFLTETPGSQIVRAFNLAFGDYALKMDDRDEIWLRNRMQKNNVDYDCSVGVFAGDELVGFSLTGIDNWRGIPSAFDAATGIVPGYRGQGLAHRMFEHALPRLRERGIQRFLLEVLQVNEPAIKAYRRVGFEATREFDCYIWKPAETRIAGSRPAASAGRVATAGPDTGSTAAAFEVLPVDKSLTNELADHLDYHPSWEISLAAIGRIPDEVLAYGAFEGDRLVGTLVYYPLLEWIVNLVVRRDARRRLVGTRLLRHLEAHLSPDTGTVKMINVERGAEGMKRFVEAVGFEFEIAQFEMAMDL
jgi:ribosomal protein S18 acetylase RimI-like enzyme